MKTTPYFAAALLAAAALRAQPAAAPAAPAAPASTTPATTPAAPTAPGFVITPDASKTTVIKAQDTLTVDFPDEDIRVILRNVADLFELNVVIPDTLVGKTSIKLHDVTWRDIYKAVLSPVGYTFIEDPKIIKVVSQDALNQEPLVTEIFILNYAKALDLAGGDSNDPKKKPDLTASPLSALISGNGEKMIVDTRINGLVVTARPTTMAKLRPVIEQLDRATDQVLIESKFIEVDSSDVKNLGVNWTSLGNYAVSAGPGSLTYNRTNATNGTNSTNNTNTTTGNSSSTFTAGSGAPTNTLTNNNTATSALTDLQGLVNNTDVSRAATAVFSAGQFTVVLNALQSLGGTKIVSNPTIVTLNNKEAEINVGEEHPIPQYTYNQQTGVYVISGFEYKPIGVILKVTPQVNAKGDIHLTLSPEVSQSTRSVPFSGTDIPILDTRKATTNVSIKDGYTMGIGGLLTKNSNKTTTKVPLLGDLPLLGRLFKTNGKNESSTNLIIFITAKTLSSDGAPIQQIFNSGDIRAMGLQPEDLPGVRDGTDPFKPLPPPPSVVKMAPAPAATPKPAAPAPAAPTTPARQVPTSASPRR